MKAVTRGQAPRLFQHLWKSILGWGVISVLLGAVILVWPGISIEVAAIFFGSYLLVSGIAQVIFGFTLEVPGAERLLLFVSGGLSLALGVLAFRHLGEGYAVLLLAIWVGVGFIFQGVAETALAISNPGLPGRGWHIFMGVLSIIAGMVVMTWPFSSIVVLAVVTGVSLVVLGVCQIVWGLQARKAVKDVGEDLGRMAGVAG